MVDVLTPDQRRLNMSRIRSRDTIPEMKVRRGLHARGLRFRLHDRRLPGRPDLVLLRYRTVVFIHGCFWHKHGCKFSTIPATRQDFWREKIEANAARDRMAIENLQTSGWHVLVIWECSLRGRGRSEEFNMLDRAACYIRKGQHSLFEIAGDTNINR